MVRAKQQGFDRLAPGLLQATSRTTAPLGAGARIRARLRSTFIGAPLSNSQYIHERLTKVKALAVFSSDCISSSAYATEEILRVLFVAVGVAAFSLVVGVTVAMLGVLFLSGYLIALLAVGVRPATLVSGFLRRRAA